MEMEFGYAKGELLQGGDIFTFTDTKNAVYMMSLDERHYINLSTGEIFTIKFEDYDRKVKRCDSYVC